MYTTTISLRCLRPMRLVRCEDRSGAAHRKASCLVSGGSGAWGVSIYIYIIYMRSPHVPRVSIEFFNDGLKLNPRDENLNAGLAKATSFEKSLVSVAFTYTNIIH